MHEEKPTPTQKRIAPAAERNKEPILNQLRQLLKQGERVLEIGSGTGQHACYFSQRLPDITWQPTELAGGLKQIQLWLAEHQLQNLAAPVEFDVRQANWPFKKVKFDVVYTCNTLHIMPEDAVEVLFGGVGDLLTEGGRFCAYGPFSFSGKHSAASNVAFDSALRSEGNGQGVRDMAWLDSLARQHGLTDARLIEMPSNNFIAVWHVAG